MGVGNAVVDVISKATDLELKAAELNKGRMHLVEASNRLKLPEKMETSERSPGGSAANVTHGVRLLGATTAFIGKLGDDKLGKVFIEANSDTFLSPPPEKGKVTAHCLVLVTPDAERTMQTFISAELRLKKEDIDLNLVKSSRLVCLEGYLCSSEAEVLEHIAAHAPGAVAFMLSDPGLMRANRSRVIEFLRRRCDILIGNLEEAKALAATDSPKQAVEFCRGLCPTGAITSSGAGSVVYKEEETVEIPSFKPLELVDSTGAGDAYTAAFLYGLLRNDPIKDCGLAAAKTATQVLESFGGRLPADLGERLARLD